MNIIGFIGSLRAEITMRYTLKQLEDVPREKRGAVFCSVAAVVSPEGKTHTFVGEVYGTILFVPTRPCRPKMPYEPIFLPDGYTKSFAEMTIDKMNGVNHRGRAFAKVRTFFKKIMAPT